MLRVCRNKDNGVSMKKIPHPVFIILLVILSATLVSCGLRGGGVHAELVDVAHPSPSHLSSESGAFSLDRRRRVVGVRTEPWCPAS